MTEIEVKIHVANLSAVESSLRDKGAELKVPRVYERNVRYENATRTLTEQGIVVRLREDNRVRLTYKSPIGDADGIVSREELEVDVSDFATMDAILDKLGYTPYMVYEKYRTTYEWLDTEIVLDEMPFGNFIEIEGEKNVILAVLSALDLKDEPRISMSYSGLFDVVRQALNLAVRDLTFANFEGVDVPAKLFFAS